MEPVIQTSALRQVPIAAFCNRFGFYFSVILVVFSPVSTSVAVVATIAMFLFFLLSGDWKQKFNLLLHPVVLVAVLLFLWVVLGAFYSHARFASALGLAFKYDKLLVIGCLLYFLNDNPVRQKAVLFAAVTGIVVNLVAIYLNYYVLSKHPIVFSAPSFPGAQSNGLLAYIFSVAAFTSFFWAKAAADKRVRSLLYLLAILSLIAGIALNLSRTGYIIMLALLIGCALYQYRLRGMVYSILIGAVIFGGAYFLSYNFHRRVNQAVVNVSHYVSEEGNENTSAGERLTFYRTMIGVLQHYPQKLLWGFGTSSSKLLSTQYLNSGSINKAYKIKPFDNPHNQYLFFLAENGLIGLLLFLMFFYVIYKNSKFQDKPWAITTFIVVTGFAVGCLFNSWLHDFAPALTFITYVGILSSISTSLSG